MKPFARSERVGGQIQKTLSVLLQKDIKDPRLQSTVITSVKMSRDLKSARVYYTILGNSASKNQVLEAMESARGYVKRALAGRLGLRYMPELHFYYDESLDYGSRMDEILKSLKIENESNSSTSEKE